ncbi:E3 ubiquitin-protein ligase HUWE1 isoform X2 [Culicoides brevitarsis]|uniref:E3 ubiquitin-protein ligase HUWE1 isoform X2 n=1 Tax=Culicoides brevitarsis TaxID=469753 RepID=UPI00307C56ED
MKVDTSRLKKGPSEIPPECQQLIDRLRLCNRQELALELAKIETWTFGKCELCHWIEILDIFDDILADATFEDPTCGLYMTCDVSYNEEDTNLLLLVLNFTTLLIEHSFSRHLYNSIEHLTALLQSINLDIVLGVLNLLYMFSKRSNFLSRLGCNKKSAVSNRLKYIAENWGGKDSGFGLADCCCENIEIPASVSSFFYEYYKSDGSMETVHLDDKELTEKDIRLLTEQIVRKLNDDITDDQKYHIFCRVRLSKTFKDYKSRLLLVQARLQALSVLIYSDALTGHIHQLIYPGFLEELVELLELQKPNLVEIRAAALRTLTSIIHLERSSQYMRKTETRLNVIIDVTGASSYHGFLPSMVRSCINNLIASTTDSNTDTSQFPLQLATALFSFLYHLASYEGGAESLVSCGMMESLLKVINWSGNELEHITFVTRAVRVIDLITNIDMQSFQSHDGLNNFIERLNIEVNLCRIEQPYEIKPNRDRRSMSPELYDQQSEAGSNLNSIDELAGEGDSMHSEDVHMTQESGETHASHSSEDPSKNVVLLEPLPGRACLPQRAALLKSMLNFLKKAIQDTTFSDSIRHVMEGSLPNSLKHIISNAEYYGPSLFLLATDVVTVYVFQEPSFLSSLQDNGLTDVILQALLKKDVPATREVLGSLPNVFSALCLNTRGLLSFVKYNPFDKLFKVLLSPVYLSAMRRRRSSDPIGDTASNLGNAMDELMRNQPSLKTDATKAIIKLLQDLVELGTDPKYICWRAQNKNEVSPNSGSSSSRQSNANNADLNAGSSDDDDEDEEEASTSSHNNHRDDNGQNTAETTNTNTEQEPAQTSSSASERIPIALIDYILNVMKFVDAILSNNSTDDHCREFVEHGGLQPLLAILSLPNLPVTSCNTPITASAQAVASVCKSILNLAHEPQVLQVGLEQLSGVVENLKPLQSHLEQPNGSVLLRELANCGNIDQAFTNASATPILHAMNAVHGYVVMLVHVCRTGQADIRMMSLTKWSQDNAYGKQLLQKLVQLYTALVWESTLLLALCTDDISTGCNFGKEDIDKMIPSDLKGISEVNWNEVVVNLSAMEGKTDEQGTSLVSNSMEVENSESNSSSKSGNGQKKVFASATQLKYIKSLLLASSRLGRALAELFGLLVKLSVGSPTRQRRGQNFPATPQYTSPASKEIARVLSYILVDGLSFNKLPPSPIPKLKLIFLICSVGFTSPMLFDEKRFAYHLMLQKFIEEGGLEVFFEMFRWALTAGHTIPIHRAVESNNLPDGTGEFLDAWLILLEKMVNPRAILESPHVISTKTSRQKPEFDSTQYLINVHRFAYQSVMHLWGCAPLKTYGLRMSESILTILKHIFRGEKIIAEKYVDKSKEKEKEAEEKAKTDPAEGSSSTTTTNEATGEASTSTTTNNVAAEAVEEADPRVNPVYLSALMDMGFNREQCTEALLATGGSVEQATEYLLNNTTPMNNSELSAAISEEIASNIPNSMDVDVTEEVIRAILMSIGDSSSVMPSSTGATKKNEAKPGTSTGVTTVAPIKEAYKKYLTETPLPKTTFDHFSESALKTCLQLLDTLPDAVYRVCDLLVTISKRNGDTWRDDMLNNLVDEISDCLDFLIRVLNSEESMDESEQLTPESFVSGEMASKTAVRIHLFTLLFEGQYQELKIPCASAMVRKDVLPKLVKVIIDIERIMKTGDKKPTVTTPKWLAPLFLLVDLYEKVAVYTQRKAEMHKVTTRTWKWYDLSTAKWNAYSPASNKVINDAYWNNEPSARITFGRQRYTINFSCMNQVNEETGNHRPVILSLKCMEKDLPIFAPTSSTSVNSSHVGAGDSATNAPTAVPAPMPELGASEPTSNDASNNPEAAIDINVTKIDATKMDTASEEKETLESKFPNVVLDGLEQFQTKDLVAACVRLMAHDFDKDTLHAIMRVCLRLTRNYENAEVFAKEGGVKLLLQMKQSSGYVGFTTLATLLIRHVIEEPKTLTLAMENAIYSRTLPIHPPGCKELLYMTRQMSSAISRNPAKFKEVAQQILRIDVEILKRNQLNEDNRYLLKSVHPQGTRDFKLEDPTAVQAVKDLLQFLIQPDVPVTRTSNNQTQSGSKSSSSKNYTSIETRAEQSNRSTDNRFDDIFSPIANPRTTSAVSKANELINQAKSSMQSGNNDKILLSKTDILSILGDAVRSYQTVSLLITQHVYKAGSIPSINEDITALAYILDKLLYSSENGQDKECGTVAQFLISGLAATSDVVSVQFAVVTEVKAALLRAFNMPESMEKHLQIEMITGLIPVMIDSYVSADNHLLSKSQQFQSARYNIFYIMLRKGLISDLAKAAQYLDLSGPHTVATINYILKSLELLLRMSNEPQMAASIFNKKKSGTQNPVVPGSQASTSGQASTSTSGNVAVTPSTSGSIVARRNSRSSLAAGRTLPTAVQEEQQQQSTSGAPLSESTVAQDETMTDDSENTDYDISAVPESGIETTSEAQIQVDLSEILNSFLRDDLNNEGGDRGTRSRLLVTDESIATVEGENDVVNENDDAGLSNMRGETGDTSSESGDDSVSNASDQEGPELEEEEEEASENEDEGDEQSDLDVDEETRQFIEMYDQSVYSVRSPNIPELERDNEDVLMIQYNANSARGDNDAETGDNAGNGGNNAAGGSIAEIRIADLADRRPFSNEQSRRRLEQSRADAGPSSSNAGGNDEGQGTVAAHPLLVRRHSTSQSNEGPLRYDGAGVNRGSRSGRQRRLNYISTNGRSTNPPIILQRLLGPSSTNAGGTVTLRAPNGVVLMDHFNLISSNDDENGDIDLTHGHVYNRGISNHTNNHSTALSWWFEESRILGLESQPDVCLTICDQLVPDLEKYKAQDLAKSRSKRKKKVTEEQEKTSEENNEAQTANNATNSNQNQVPATQESVVDLMDVSEPPFDSSTPIVNQNINATSTQLEEMQINSDGEPRQAQSSAVQENQANNQAETTSRQSTLVDGDSEMNDASSMRPQSGETFGSLNAESFFLEESEDSVDENLHSQRNSDEDDSSESDTDEEDNEQYIDDQSENLPSSEQNVATQAVTIAEINTVPTETASNPPTNQDVEMASNQDAGTAPMDTASTEEGAVGGTTNDETGQPSTGTAENNQEATPQTVPSASQQDIDPAIRSILGDLEVPEGIDASFLAALPPEMREEVIAEHMRQQRIRQRATQPPAVVANETAPPVAEVNPEFLAALPPNIQEEVLAQQRLEQQRQAAVNMNPNDPVDAAAFFQNLTPSLRQAILTDMEESQISVLPPELAAEAQNLRRDWESRNRQMMQMRLLNQIGRNVDPRQYLPRTSYIQLNSNAITIRGGVHPSNVLSNMERQGGPLLDHEALASILVLLFIDDPNISTLRLYRVIKNLCYHVPTRKWIIRALLSIVEKCSEELNTGAKFMAIEGGNMESSKPEWLNIRLDSALSCRTNVFLMKRPNSAGGVIRKNDSPITVHPKASPIVCRHIVDLLIFLAKSFPVHFLPLKKTTEPQQAGTSTNLATSSTNTKTAKATNSNSSSSSSGTPKKEEGPVAGPSNADKPTEFWEILSGLDAKINQQRKLSSKQVSRPPKEFNEPDIVTFDVSPFGQLIKILAHETVKNSSQLTDKVLRLLSLISVALPDSKNKAGGNARNKPPQNYQVKNLFDDNNQSETEFHLGVIVQVLTSKACSEDGLEDATALLLNLSKCSNKTRYVIHHLLLNGAYSVSCMVLRHINDLMTELRQLKQKRPDVPVEIKPPVEVMPVDEDMETPSTSVAQPKATNVRGGILQDRFTKDQVIIMAPNKVKSTGDLQLPSMAPLISKTSSQAFFLRILKVITQIRDSVYQTMKNEANSATKTIEPNQLELSPLSETLKLDTLWDTLSECLKELEETSDHHAVLVLQPTVEAFFLVHASSQNKNACALLKEQEEKANAEAQQGEQDAETTESAEATEATAENQTATVTEPSEMESTPTETQPTTSAMEGQVEQSAGETSNDDASSSLPKLGLLTQLSQQQQAPPVLDPDQKKFLQFAETHRVVLNQILRQSTTHLADGPFAVLVDHTRILDFDIKRRYFRTELERLDEGIRREELAIHVHRVTVFEDSFRELYRRTPEEWKNRFYIVFEDEEGQDAGGLLREWYVIISREIFNPMYALFCVSPGDRVTYMINPSSHANPNHLCYYKFVGRVIAKAIYDNKLLECYFTRSFYKHILGTAVKYTDMESEDYEFYQGLVFLIEHTVAELGYDLTFSLEVQEFGVTEVRDLIPNGRNIVVTEETKLEYVHLVCQLKMSGSIRQQLNAFLEGFYDIIPKRLISIFNEQELELLISGLPNIDIEDLKVNTEYHKYQANSIQVQWFWRALRSFDQADRAKFLQFVTGTSKVPLQGFASLEGMNGIQKFQIHRDDRSTDRLPSAHTCFNQLDLPVYKTYDKLRSSLLKAIHECSEGFGFA